MGIPGPGYVSGNLNDDGLQQLHKDLGVGFYLQAYFPFEINYHNVKVNQETIKHTKVTTYETPYGTLREAEKYLTDSHCWAPVEYLIKDASDMKAFRYLYENLDYTPNYWLAEHRRESVGDNGLVVAYTQKSPMMELVALKAGLETVVTELLAEEPDELEELLELMTKKHSISADIAIASPAEAIFVPDNLSSEMVGGSIYDNYIKEVHEDWTARIREAGKKSMVHLDGTLNPLLGKLSRAGFDVIEAVTPAPVGDIKPEDLRSHVQENTIIWGCAPSGFFSDTYPEEEFEKWFVRILEMMRKDRRFVLGVADQVVPGTSFERLKKVSEFIEKYGKFED